MRLSLVSQHLQTLERTPPEQACIRAIHGKHRQGTLYLGRAEAVKFCGLQTLRWWGSAGTMWPCYCLVDPFVSLLKVGDRYLGTLRSVLYGESIFIFLQLDPALIVSFSWYL
jgi:hypothetical protein